MHLPRVVGLLLTSPSLASILSSSLRYDDKSLGGLLALRERGVTSSPVSNGHRASTRRHMRAKQQVLTGIEANRPDHAVEIWDAPFPNQLLIPAALGNPPQPFRLLVDLAWDTLWVPSADLDTTYLVNDDDDLLRYTSNQSSTFIPGHQHLGIAYGTDAYDGDVAVDEFRIATMSVPNQPFLNADEARPLGWVDFWFGYDGVLGLAPRWNTSISDSLTPSPWSMMVNQSLLDRNIFTLDLPHGPRGIEEITRTGTVTFGSIDPKYASSDFTTLPISNYTDRAWAIPAHSVTWHNETHPIHKTFTRFTLAGFDTTAWFIGLPGGMSSQIYASMPDVQCGFAWCFIDCNMRKSLPDFTVGLIGADGDVKNFTVTPYDYAPEFKLPAKQRICSFEFAPTDDAFPVDAVILGPGFMSAFYTVFDLDAREVRLTKAMA